MSAHLSVGQSDFERVRALKEGVLGWSKLPHFIVFRELMRAKPNADILVCGVYHGLDLRYMQGIADDLGQTVRLTGVDRFEDSECDDWPEDKKGKGFGWQVAAGCPPPDMDSARRNAPTANLVKDDSLHFLRETEQQFDIVWLDSAHNYEQVVREIQAGLRVLKPGGLLGGDDYVWGVETGGVDRAVQAMLPQHTVWFKTLWVAQP